MDCTWAALSESQLRFWIYLGWPLGHVAWAWNVCFVARLDCTSVPSGSTKFEPLVSHQIFTYGTSLNSCARFFMMRAISIWERPHEIYVSYWAQHFFFLLHLFSHFDLPKSCWWVPKLMASIVVISVYHCTTMQGAVHWCRMSIDKESILHNFLGIRHLFIGFFTLLFPSNSFINGANLQRKKSP